MLLRQCWWCDQRRNKYSICGPTKRSFLQFSNSLNDFSTGRTMFAIIGITIPTSIRGSFGCIMHTTNHVESVRLLYRLCRIVICSRCRCLAWPSNIVVPWQMPSTSILQLINWCSHNFHKIFGFVQD